MAPPKGQSKPKGKITSFFSKTPPSQHSPSDDSDDEIVLATSSFTSAANGPRYCYCNQPESGQMVECDGEHCKREWYHLACVDLPQAPLEKWYCRDCRPRVRSSAGGRIHTKPSNTASRSISRESSTRSQKRGSPPTAKAASLTPSPQRSFAKFNVNPLTGRFDVTPTRHSPYRNPSATPPKQRIVLGPASSPANKSLLDPDSPIVLPTRPSPAALKVSVSKPAAIPAPSASFSSISTLARSSASIPISVASSSKRVVKGGLNGVADSDSDEDSDELEDASIFFQNKRLKLSLPAHAEERSTNGVTRSVRPQVQSSRIASQGVQRRLQQSLIASPPKQRFHKGFSSLAAQQREWQMEEAIIASVESAVEQAKRREEEEEQLDALLHVDRDTLTATTGSDEEGGERMQMAIARTEIMRHKNHYHFFLDDRPLFENAPFPLHAILEQPWSVLYKETWSRRQACISGFAAEVASAQPLPLPVTNWLAQQLLHEQDADLCEAYIGILEACVDWQESVSDTIASVSSMYKTRSFFEYGWKDSSMGTGLPPGLRHILRLVQFCAPASDSARPDAVPSKTIAAFVDLSMINIDEHVKADLGLSMTVIDCIEAMLDRLSDDAFDSLIPEAVGTIFLPGELEPLIRCRVIAALPASTTRTYLLRRRLALEHFSLAVDRKSADEQDWAESICLSLQSKIEFQISEHTDYDLLMAAVDVLDIAVSAGFLPYNEVLPPDASTPVGVFRRAPPLTPAAKQHNAQIDSITSKLGFITARIRDAGTTHLLRMEVKGSIERLIVRLEHSVRSRPKPKKTVFGGAELQQKSLKSFALPGDERPAVAEIAEGCGTRERSKAGSSRILKPDPGTDESEEEFQTCAEISEDV